MILDPISLSVERFAEDLALIARLGNEGRHEEAAEILRRNLDYVMPIGPRRFRALSDLEIQATLIETNSLIWVPVKKAMLIALLKHTGDYSRIKGEEDVAKEWHLTALRLLLDFRDSENPAPFSSILPTIDSLLTDIGEASLPTQIRLALSWHFEREGLLKRAVEQIATSLNHEPDSRSIKAFAIKTMNRLSRLSEEKLAAGGVRSADIETELKRLRAVKI